MFNKSLNSSEDLSNFLSYIQSYLGKNAKLYKIEFYYNGGAGHTSGSLSCIDILNVLYNNVLQINPNNFSSTDRNRYVQSKGHTVEALYTVLCDQNFFSRKDLNSLNKFNSHFIGHPTRKVPGIEHNTGALGHGLSVAVGMAIGFKLDNKPYKV